MAANQQDIMDFERTRNTLLTISAQKQQLQIQGNALDQAITELGKTSEKKVYKAVGNILIMSSTDEVKKDLEEQKESTDLKVKTLQKQEDSTVEKLNKLKHKIESNVQGQEEDEVEQE